MAQQNERRPAAVQDRPTENGVKLNNILTGLLLAASLWVGSSVEALKEAVVILATKQEHDANQMHALQEKTLHNSKRILTLERLHPEFFSKKPLENEDG